MTLPDELRDAELAEDLAAVRRHTALLVEHTTALGDVRAPSLCDGWSRAHVLAHVARALRAEGALPALPRGS